MPDHYGQVPGAPVFNAPTAEELEAHYDSIFESDPEMDNNLFGAGINRIHEEGSPTHLPTKEEILDSGRVAEYEKTGWRPGLAADVVWNAVKRAPASVLSSAIKAVQGGEGVEVDPEKKDFFEKLSNRIDESNQAYAQGVREKAQDQSVLPGGLLKIKDVADLPQNLGFSLANMAAGLGAGGAVAALPIPGARPAAYAAGMAASGAVAQRATEFEFMDEALSHLNELKTDETGEGLTDKEVIFWKDKLADLAFKHSLWEAIPEAIGNAAQIGIILRPLGKILGANFLSRMITKFGGMQAEEMLTETITEMGQTGVAQEATKMGALPDRGDPPLDYKSWEQWYSALKKVAPQTFMLTALLGGGGAAAVEGRRLIKGDTFQEDLEDPDYARSVKDAYNDAIKNKEYLNEHVTHNMAMMLAKRGEQIALKFPNDSELESSMNELESNLEARAKSDDAIQDEMIAFEQNPLDEQNNANLIEKFTERDEGVQLNLFSDLPQIMENQAFEDTRPEPDATTATGTSVISGNAPKYSFKSEGVSTTEAAIQFGEKAKGNPQIIEELKTQYAKGEVEVARLQAEGQLEEAFDLAQRNQFYREAAEVAEGKGPKKTGPKYSFLPGGGRLGAKPVVPSQQGFDRAAKDFNKVHEAVKGSGLQIAIRDNKTGQVHTSPNAKRHLTVSLRNNLPGNIYQTTNYDAGYLTPEGQFLTRKEAAEHIGVDNLVDELDSEYFEPAEAVFKQRFSWLSQGPSSGIEIVDIARAFPGATIGRAKSDRGTTTVKFDNGIELEVQEVKSITPELSSVVGRWRPIAEQGQQPTGAYQDATIKLRKGFGDKWTLHHESWHFIEDFNLINPRERAALRGRVIRDIRNGKLTPNDKNSPGSEEDLADWVANHLYQDKGVKPKGLVGNALAKIRRFLDRLVQYIRPTSEGVVRSMRSGDIFRRTPGQEKPQAWIRSSQPKYNEAANRWYSQMSKDLPKFIPGKKPMPVKTAIDRLKALTIPSKGKPAKVKPQELKWSGLIEWLQDREEQAVGGKSNAEDNVHIKYEITPKAEAYVNYGQHYEVKQITANTISKGAWKILIDGNRAIKKVFATRDEAAEHLEKHLAQVPIEIVLTDPYTDISMQGEVDPKAYWGLTDEQLTKYDKERIDVQMVTTKQMTEWLDANSNLQMMEVLRGPKGKGGKVYQLIHEEDGVVDTFDSYEEAESAMVDITNTDEYFDETEFYIGEQSVVKTQRPKFIPSVSIHALNDAINILADFPVTTMDQFLDAKRDIKNITEYRVAPDEIDGKVTWQFTYAGDDPTIQDDEMMFRGTQDFLNAMNDVYGQSKIDEIQGHLETLDVEVAPEIQSRFEKAYKKRERQAYINAFEDARDELADTPIGDEFADASESIDDAVFGMDSVREKHRKQVAGIHPLQGGLRLDPDTNEVVLFVGNSAREESDRVEFYNADEIIDYYNIEGPADGSGIITSAFDVLETGAKVIRDKMDSLLWGDVEGALEPTKYMQYSTSGARKNYRELTIQADPPVSPTGDVTQYQSPHWEERNNIFHIRFQDREDERGNKILLIDEIQSDYHQEARRDDSVRGWWVKDKADGANISGPFDTKKEAQAWIDEPLGDQANEIASDQSVYIEFNDERELPYEHYELTALRRMIRWAAEEGGYSGIAWTTGAQQAGRYETEIRKKVDKITWAPVVDPFPEIEPDYPFAIKIKDGGLILDNRFQTEEKAWAALRKNITHKYLQTKDIYEVVNIVDVAKENQKDPLLFINAEKGNQSVMEEKQVRASELEGIVGDSMAKRIRKEYENGQLDGEITGDDIAIGAEGFQGFYDKILPSIFKKNFGKATWGKPQVTKTQLIMSDAVRERFSVVARGDDNKYDIYDSVNNDIVDTGFDNWSNANDSAQAMNRGAQPIKELGTFWHVPMTEEMQVKALKEGFPYYSFKNGSTALKGVAADNFRGAMAQLGQILKPAKLSFVERLLKSPEWYNHPLFKKLTQYAVDRSEIFNSRLEKLDNEATTTAGVSAQTVQLRNKGLTKRQIRKGQTSKEYEDLKHMIEIGDTKYVMSPNGHGTEEEQTKEFIADLKSGVWKYDKEKDKYSETEGKPIRVSDETIAVWQSHRNAYDRALQWLIDPMQRMLDENGDAQDFIVSEDETGKKSKLSLADAISYMGSLKGFYAPRLRDRGNWVVQSAKGFHEDADFESRREHFKSRFAAEKHKLKLQRAGYDVADIFEDMASPEEMMQKLRVVTAQQLFEQAAERGDTEVSQDLLNKFKEDLIREAANMIKARGFRSTMIARRKDSLVKGYIEDPHDRYIRYASNISAGLAKNEVAEKMGEAVMEFVASQGGQGKAIEPRVYNTASKYIESQMRNNDAIDVKIGQAKALASFKFLGLPNVRAPFINMTALVTTTPPAIHQYAMKGEGTIKSTLRPLMKAAGDARRYLKARTKNNDKGPDNVKGLNKEEIDALNAFATKGWLKAQMTSDIMGEMQGQFGKFQTKWMNRSMYLFGYTESMNRGATFLAGYRLARKQGQSDAEARKNAQDATSKAHGIYGKATLPEWAQGTNPLAKVGQLFYVYKKFAHNMLQLAWDMGLNQKNYKGAVWAMAAPIVLGGGSSIAFRSMFFGLIVALMRAMGDDRDPEKMVYDGIREHFGAIGEHTARYGAVGLILNADISGSLSVDGSWPPKAQDFLGAPFALVTDTLAGLDYVRTMQPWRGLEVMAPVGVGNILRSLRETDGVTTRAGRPVFDQKGKLFTPTAAESVKRAAGFRSARVATAQSSSFESKKEKKAFAEKRATIYEIYRSYLQNKDLRKYRKVIKLMKQYNEELKKSGRSKVLPKVTKESLERQAKAFKKQPKSERR